MHVILPICELCICEFTYLLEFIFNPQIKACGIFEVIQGHVQSGERKRRKKKKRQKWDGSTEDWDSNTFQEDKAVSMTSKFGFWVS